MEQIFDWHTHTPGRTDAIINLAEGAEVPADGLLYSAGVHPWLTVDPGAVERYMKWLREIAPHPSVAAIGECGLDGLRGAPLEVQMPLFVEQARLAEELGKQLTVHCVRAWEPLFRAHNIVKPRASRWMIHGFRGKPELARQLLRAGMVLSFGEGANPASVAVVPAEQRLYETDDSLLPIADIAALCNPPINLSDRNM